VIYVEKYNLVPISNLLESERIAWGDQIGVVVPIAALPDAKGQVWVKYEDYAYLEQENERLKGGQS
jgi:hypothetical protein